MTESHSNSANCLGLDKEERFFLSEDNFGYEERILHLEEELEENKIMNEDKDKEILDLQKSLRAANYLVILAEDGGFLCDRERVELSPSDTELEDGIAKAGLYTPDFLKKLVDLISNDENAKSSIDPSAPITVVAERLAKAGLSMPHFLKRFMEMSDTCQIRNVELKNLRETVSKYEEDLKLMIPKVRRNEKELHCAQQEVWKLRERVEHLTEEISEKQRMLTNAFSELQSTRTKNEDLSKQVQYLLLQIENPDRKSGSNVDRSDIPVSLERPNELISHRYILFKDIQELQQQNQCLLVLLRGMATDREKETNLCKQLSCLQKKLDHSNSENKQLLIEKKRIFDKWQRLLSKVSGSEVAPEIDDSAVGDILTENKSPPKKLSDENDELDQAKSEIVQLQRKNDELLEKLKQAEKNISAQAQHGKDMVSRVNTLQEERGRLEKELKELRPRVENADCRIEELAKRLEKSKKEADQIRQIAAKYKKLYGETRGVAQDKSKSEARTPTMVPAAPATSDHSSAYLQKARENGGSSYEFVVWPPQQHLSTSSWSEVSQPGQGAIPLRNGSNVEKDKERTAPSDTDQSSLAPAQQNLTDGKISKEVTPPTKDKNVKRHRVFATQKQTPLMESRPGAVEKPENVVRKKPTAKDSGKKAVVDEEAPKKDELGDNTAGERKPDDSSAAKKRRTSEKSPRVKRSSMPTATMEIGGSPWRPPRRKMPALSEKQ